MQEGKLGGDGLAEHQASRAPHHGDQRSIRARPVAGVERRTVLGREVGGVEDVLDADRQSAQRQGFEGSRVCFSLLLGGIDIECGESADLGFACCNRLGAQLDHVGWRQFAAVDAADEIEHRQHQRVPSRLLTAARRSLFALCVMFPPARDVNRKAGPVQAPSQSLTIARPAALPPHSVEAPLTGAFPFSRNDARRSVVASRLARSPHARRLRALVVRAARAVAARGGRAMPQVGNSPRRPGGRDAPTDPRCWRVRRRFSAQSHGTRRSRSGHELCRRGVAAARIDPTRNACLCAAACRGISAGAGHFRAAAADIRRRRIARTRRSISRSLFRLMATHHRRRLMDARRNSAHQGLERRVQLLRRATMHRSVLGAPRSPAL